MGLAALLAGLPCTLRRWQEKKGEKKDVITLLFLQTWTEGPVKREIFFIKGIVNKEILIFLWVWQPCWQGCLAHYVGGKKKKEKKKM